MDKVIRDGKVAVLYSPGWGAGWYTWNREYPDCIYDPDIVALLENGKRKDIAALAEKKWENFYAGGSGDLEIEWLPEGTPFRIDEFDGNESITTSVDFDLTA